MSVSRAMGIFLALMSAAWTVSAGVVTWNGSVNGDWSNNANWAGNAAPVSNDTVVLTGSGVSPTNQNIAGLYLAGLTISNTVPDGFVLAGNGLSIKSPLSVQPVSFVARRTIAAPLTLAQDVTVDFGSAVSNSVLVLQGSVSDGGLGFGLTSQGTSGKNVLILTGTNTYTGKTTAHTAAVMFSQDRNLGAAPGAFVFDSITANYAEMTFTNLPGTLFWETTLSSNRGFRTVGGSLRVPTGNRLTLAGRITGGLSRYGAGTLILNGPIADGSGTTNLYYDRGVTVLGSSSVLGAGGSLRLQNGVVDLNGYSPTGIVMRSYDANDGCVINTSTNEATLGPVLIGYDYVQYFFGGPGDIRVQGDVNESYAEGVSAKRSLRKGGSGRVTLLGTGYYSNDTIIAGGTLELDYRVNNTRKLSSTTNNVCMASATLRLIGSDAAPTVEVISNLVMRGDNWNDGSYVSPNNGASVVEVRAGASQDCTLSFSRYQLRARNPTDFRTVNNGGGTARIIGRDTTNIVASGILSCQATYNGTTWAMVDANSNIVGLADSAYTNAIVTDRHVSLPAGVTSLAANTTIESLRFNATGSASCDIPSGKTLTLHQRSRNSGYDEAAGILVTPNVGNNNITISGAGAVAVTDAYNFDLMIHQYNTNGLLTISAKVSGGAGSRFPGLTHAGVGTTVLSNDSNDFYNGLYVLGGTLSVSSIRNSGTNSAAGDGRSAPDIYLGNATLKYTGPGDSSNRRIMLRGLATLDASGSGTMRFTTNIVSVNSWYDLVLTGTGTGQVDGVIAISRGGVTKRGTGTWVLNGTNTYMGRTTVEAGTLQVNGVVAGDVAVAAGGALRSKGGTLGQNLAMNGTLVYESSASSTSLVVRGNVTLGGDLSVVSPDGYRIPEGVTVPILAVDGTLTGQFGSMTGGYTIKMSDDGRQVLLARRAPGFIFSAR